VADSDARTEDAGKNAGDCDWGRDSDWREILSAMAEYGPGDSHILFLFLVVSWWPLFELSAAATLVILSGLVLWFDGTAYNFIRSGVEFRIYPSRLATPQWANRKTFQSVGRPFSRRRKLRVAMAGTGRNLRGNFPWDTVAEPSPAKSKGKKQAQSGQAVVAESQSAASTGQATRISNTGDQIYASLPERVKAESTAAWAQCDGQLEGITLAQTLGAAFMLKKLPEVRQRVHPAIQGNGEVQEVEVSGILATLTRESASEIFCSLDKELNLNPSDLLLSGSILFKPRMTREDGTGLGEFVSMAVQGVPISDKMIASLNGGESDLTKTWDVKPMLPRADRLSQPMLLLSVTGPNLNMLNLLVAAGLSKPDLERLIMRQLNEAVGKPAVTEVCFQDTVKKTVLDDNGRSQHYPMAVDFNKHGKALVVCRAPADIEDILTKTKYRLEINCGQILEVPEFHKNLPFSVGHSSVGK
jgi:hypothetical protein